MSQPPKISQRTPPLPHHNQTRPTTRIITNLVKLLLFALVMTFTVRALHLRLATISWDQINIHPAPLLAAALCLALATVLAAYVFYLLLAAFASTPTWPIVCAIMSVVRLGKYLPGKFASTAGAVWLFQRQGVPVSAAAGMTLTVQGIMVVLGLTTAVPLTLYKPVYDRLPLAWLWCALLLLAGIVCLHPKVFRSISNLVLALLKLPLLPRSVTMRDYARPIGLLLTCQILTGSALWLIIRSITTISPLWLPLCVSAMALAGTAGFLALFAPAGIGVREGILLIILGPIVGSGYSALVVVLVRLLLILVDLASAGLGWLILLRVDKRRNNLG